MTDLPLPLRQSLTNNFSLISLSQDSLVTGNKTVKAKLKLKDNLFIETVLMDYGTWQTACLSVQVGCPLACRFCATGTMGFIRNLKTEEIIDQILFWQHYLYPKYVGRIVFMGMGEPFLNWENLVNSLHIINSPQCLNIGQRKISISTAGIVPQIKSFADLNSEINLAISLHAPDQATRLRLMPVAQTFPLDRLLQACQYYVKKTNRQLFFEYAPISGINDSSSQVQNLIDIIKSNRLFYLNIIPLNPTSTGLTPTPSQHFQAIVLDLKRQNVNFSVRQSLGLNSTAACGQLVTSS